MLDKFSKGFISCVISNFIFISVLQFMVKTVVEVWEIMKEMPV